MLPATTDFAVLARLPSCDAALLLCTLVLGGRTHQVRRHLFRARLHVWGDTTYGPGARENGAFREAHGLRRMFLHACALTLPPPPPPEAPAAPGAEPEAACASADDAAAGRAVAPRGLHVVAPLTEELQQVLAGLPGVPPPAVLAARLRALAPDCDGALGALPDRRWWARWLYWAGVGLALGVAVVGVGVRVRRA